MYIYNSFVVVVSINQSINQFYIYILSRAVIQWPSELVNIFQNIESETPVLARWLVVCDAEQVCL